MLEECLRQTISSRTEMESNKVHKFRETGNGYASDRRRRKEEGRPMPSVFDAPEDRDLFQVWQRNIPRIDRQFTPEDHVCDLHFTEDCLDRVKTYELPDGRRCEKKRARPVLKPGSAPTLFPKWVGDTSYIKRIRMSSTATEGRSPKKVVPNDAPSEHNKETLSEMKTDPMHNGEQCDTERADVISAPGRSGIKNYPLDRGFPVLRLQRVESVLPSKPHTSTDPAEMTNRGLPFRNNQKNTRINQVTAMKITDKMGNQELPAPPAGIEETERTPSLPSEQPIESGNKNESKRELKKRLKDKVKFLESKLSKTRGACDQLRQSLEDASKTMSTLQGEVVTLTPDTEWQLKAAESTINKLRNQLKMFQLEMDKLKQREDEKARLTNELADAKRTIIHLKKLKSLAERSRSGDEEESTESDTEGLEEDSVSGLVPKFVFMFRQLKTSELSELESHETLILLEYATGLSDYNTFHLLLKWLENSKHKFKRHPSKTPLCDQLLLTLLKLKLNVDNERLGGAFEIHPLLCVCIFTSIVTALHEILSTKILIPHFDGYTKSGCSECSNYQCVVEYFTIASAFASCDQAAYAETSKRRKLYRGLVACSFDGLVRFVSKARAYTIFDDVIVKESGMLDIFGEEKLILPSKAKGSDAQDICPEDEIYPKYTLSPYVEVCTTLERMRRFKILASVPFGYQKELVSKIFQLIGCLVNFYDPLFTEQFLSKF